MKTLLLTATLLVASSTLAAPQYLSENDLKPQNLALERLNQEQLRSAISELQDFATQAADSLPTEQRNISVPEFVEPGVNVLYTLTGETAGDAFGWVAEDIGDINGDGASDFITTAPFLFTNLLFPVGKIYVYSGADGTLLNSVTSPGIPVLGYSAKGAGDVNGDGVPDYVVGGFNTAMVFSGATHAILHIWFQNGEFFGSSVDKAGDLNGDGFGDVVVGARYASYRAATSGRIYAFSGFDGSLLWTRDGAKAGDELGTGIGLVGDVTGDSIPEIVAGARGAGAKERGQALVLSGADGSLVNRLRPVGRPGLVADGAGIVAGTFGLFHAFGAGDVNGDGYADIYVGDYNAQRGNTAGTGRGYLFSGLDGSRLRIFRAENKGDGLGPARGVGDVNGDGYADLFIAAYTYTGGLNNGKGYLHSGYDGSVLRTMTGNVANQFLGVDAIGLEDVNADGLTDYLLSGSGILHVIAGDPH